MGLRNRFPQWVRPFWQFDWYSCMFCGKNQWTCLHHIISPSSREYIDGKHNESILNSSPLHNFGCHIDNEVWLGKNIPELLESTKNALETMGYEMREIDQEFLEVYSGMYR